jgi:hypothetical protein
MRARLHFAIKVARVSVDFRPIGPARASTSRYGAARASPATDDKAPPQEREGLFETDEQEPDDPPIKVARVSVDFRPIGPARASTSRFPDAPRQDRHVAGSCVFDLRNMAVLSWRVREAAGGRACRPDGAEPARASTSRFPDAPRQDRHVSQIEDAGPGAERAGAWGGNRPRP